MFCSQISSPRLLEDKVSGGHTCASVDPVCVCVCVCERSPIVPLGH